MDLDGNIVERYNYDAWGRRRNPDTWEYTNVPENSLIDFVYTGHSLSRCGGKHWDEVNLINMTGRLYDPYLARVLNPDPFVSDPNSSQALNRYTYAMNNPFVYFDPNGKNVIKKFHQFRRWFRDEVYYPVVDFFNGTPNPETGQYEGGLAQQFQDWGVPSFEVGYNTSQGFFHSVNGNEPMYWEQSKVNSYEKAANVTYRARNQAASYAAIGGGESSFGFDYSSQFPTGEIAVGMDAINVLFEGGKKVFKNSKYLTKVAKFGSNPLSIIGDAVNIGYNATLYSNNKISAARFSYRSAFSISSIAGSAIIGTTFGGLAGGLVGTTIGLIGTSFEYIYDSMMPYMNSFQQDYINYSNTPGAFESGLTGVHPYIINSNGF